MDRNSKAILTICVAWAVGMSMLLVKMDKAKPAVAPSLECSVDDTLSFVAYGVTSWDMREGMLIVRSVEETHEFTLSRDTLDGETCREVYE